MSDEEYQSFVASMDAIDLLAEIMDNPEYLTDPYYASLGGALRARYAQLSVGHAK